MIRYIRSLERRILGTITGVDTDYQQVALTFDDGPHPKFTPRLLGVLEKYDAKATFFVVGELAARYPELIRQITEAGHTIGNHSWDHSSLPRLSIKRRREQIRKCESALQGHGQALLRPPFGHQTIWSRLDAFFMGYQVVAWNVLAEDWLDLSAEQVSEHLLQGVSPGAIVLLHDGLYYALDRKYLDRTATIKAVDILLSQRSDFTYVTVPQLLHYGRARKKMWVMEGDESLFNNIKKVV